MNKKFMVGQEVVMDKEHVIKSGLTGEEILVKKGDKGFIDGNGFLHYSTGNARGKMIHMVPRENLQGYDTQNIAKMIFSRLNGEFGLNDLIQDYNIENRDFVNIIEGLLADVL